MHQGTWLGWPHELTDWPGKFAPDTVGPFCVDGTLLSAGGEICLLVPFAGSGQGNSVPRGEKRVGGIFWRRPGHS